MCTDDTLKLWCSLTFSATFRSIGEQGDRRTTKNVVVAHASWSFTTGFSPRCCLLHSRDCTMVHLLRKIRLFTFRRKGKDKRNDRSSQKIKASHYTSVDSSSMSTPPRNIPKSPSGGLMQIHQRRKKKHSSIDFDSLPIIDRVPTAIGYQSSCSEEGTDDGTPRSSRYRMWEHEEEVFKQNPSDDYDYISATDDRYSIFEGLDSLSRSRRPLTVTVGQFLR